MPRSQGGDPKKLTIRADPHLQKGKGEGWDLGHLPLSILGLCCGMKGELWSQVDLALGHSSDTLIGLLSLAIYFLSLSLNMCKVGEIELLETSWVH